MKTLNETRIRINEVRRILRHKSYTDRRFRLVDTSGTNAFGYSYELVEQVHKLVDYHDENGRVCVTDWCWETVRKIASTTDTFMPAVRNRMGSLGAYAPTFDKSEIVEVMNL